MRSEIAPLNIGEECHFKGVEWYANKHPAGFAGGWNVVCIGENENNEQLFVAHGFDTPKTEREINKLLVELYNRERTPEEEEFILQENKPHLYEKRTNNFLKHFYTVPVMIADQIVQGFLVDSCRELNPELVLLARGEMLSST